MTKYQKALKENSKIDMNDEEIDILAISQVLYDQFKKLHASVISKYGVGNPAQENRKGTYERYGWMNGSVLTAITYADCLNHDKCGVWFTMDSLSMKSKELEF